MNFVRFLAIKISPIAEAVVALLICFCCCYFTLQDAVNYTSKCLSQRLFFPSNSLIHFFLIHVLLTGTQVLFQDSLRSTSLSACCPFQFFQFFFFFSEQLLVFHQFCFLFWVYPGCSEYLLSMTTQLCFSISLQYPTQYRYGIRRNQLIERICTAAQVDDLYRVQKFDFYQLN